MTTPSEHAAPVVLVAEDDRTVRQLLEIVLATEGYEVVLADDGLEALVKLRTAEPAALILDIMMPDVGGLRVLDELASEHGSTPVLIVTGDMSAADQCRDRLGADNVFEKPFDTGELVARLQAVIDAKQEGTAG